MLQMLKKLFTPKIAEKIEESPKIGFFGNFHTFSDAKAACTGYDAPQILERVAQSLMKVKNGEAVYERDSVLFNEKQFSFAVISGLMTAAAANGGRLHVLDFGGSLGSSYFQNKEFLDLIPDLQWSIVEQKHFAERGKADFEDERLRFFEHTDEVFAHGTVNVLFLSSVLPYLENPVLFLQNILSKNVPFVLIDRTGFMKNEAERLVIEYVPERIYAASYPTWFFEEAKFLEIFAPKYAKIVEFPSFCDNDYRFEDGSTGIWKGYFFRLKNL